MRENEHNFEKIRKMLLIFDKKENCDYFLSSLADHGYMKVAYNLRRIDEKTISVLENFCELLDYDSKIKELCKKKQQIDMITYLVVDENYDIKFVSTDLQECKRYKEQEPLDVHFIYKIPHNTKVNVALGDTHFLVKDSE